MKRTLLLSLLLSLLLGVTACAASGSPAPQGPVALPTTSALFGEGELELPAGGDGIGFSDEVAPDAAPENPFVMQDGDEDTPAAQSDPEEAEPPTPTPEATAAVTDTVALTASTIVSRTIFAETMSPGWTLEHSQWVDHSRQTLLKRRGEYALEFTPREDFGTLLFAVDEETEVKYDRSQVLGIRFWINVGTKELPLESLAITVLGSNDYPYFVEGDTSVDSKFQPVFQETRLYFLDFNGPIPPNQWVQVDLWLDALRYDPVYQYVTGFYIKNDRGVLRTMYIDDVQLLVREAEEE